jgi:hypothetical protein
MKQRLYSKRAFDIPVAVPEPHDGYVRDVRTSDRKLQSRMCLEGLAFIA